MSGRATFVLVPGAGGAPWSWSRLTPLLEAAGHRCVVVDLPGPDPTVDLDGYVALVVDAVRSARETPGPVVLVGQSFGGFSTSAAAAREPVDQLVLLNAMIPAPGESGGAWWSAVGLSGARREAEAAAGRDPLAPFDPLAVFFHDAADDVVAEAADQDRDESDASFGSVWPADAWPDVPTVVLVADDDRLFPPDFQRRVAQERLGLGVTEVPGGHLNALTRPVELAEELVRIAPSAGR
ncbi:alpha/beta fold hydrolase [Aeromicrobium sp.]|jgi:pimeloyl-ACP methyl ester carboxylesterase|uniref:alpha/beta fold hydrolase n=1 Tax=Aeromicrobium sp. TaxID=1871063 RepID=UPI00403433BB